MNILDKIKDRIDVTIRERVKLNELNKTVVVNKAGLEELKSIIDEWNMPQEFTINRGIHQTVNLPIKFNLSPYGSVEVIMAEDLVDTDNFSILI